MKPPFVLALDIGTSSTRSAIYDAEGQRLLGTTAQFNYRLLSGANGQAELSPAHVDRAVTRAIETTLRAWRAGKVGSSLSAIGISCFWHSLLGLDSEGHPLTPIYTWADSRAHHDAELLRTDLAESAIHSRTGCMARASFWPAKLLWLRRTRPKLFRQVARWVSVAEWIQERWCDRTTVSLSMASGTGLLDGQLLRWDLPLLRYCGLRDALLSAISDAPSPVAAKRFRRFPELQSLPWYPAIGDGAASNLGSGATGPGVAAINVGTSAALRVLVTNEDGLGLPLGLFAYRLDSRRQVLGGAVSNAGALRAWALRELKLPSDPLTLEKLMQERSRPVDGLTLLPFWLQERAPTWPDLPSAVIGITQATSALDLLQALQEATYHRLAQIAEEVEKVTRGQLAFVVSGGIQNSPNALQRLANVLGRTVHASDEPEASLSGAARLTLEKLGQRLPQSKKGRAILPEKSAIRAYAEARKRQTRLEVSLGEAKIRLNPA